METTSVNTMDVPHVIVLITSMYIFSMLGICMMISGVVQMVQTIPMIPPLCYSFLEEDENDDDDHVYTTGARVPNYNPTVVTTQPLESGIGLANTLPSENGVKTTSIQGHYTLPQNEENHHNGRYDVFSSVGYDYWMDSDVLYNGTRIVHS
jgi:hypothetical protein